MNRSTIDSQNQNNDNRIIPKEDIDDQNVNINVDNNRTRIIAERISIISADNTNINQGAGIITTDDVSARNDNEMNEPLLNSRTNAKLLQNNSKFNWWNRVKAAGADIVETIRNIKAGRKESNDLSHDDKLIL